MDAAMRPILIAEDDQSCRSVLSAIAARTGRRAVETETGDAALAAALHERPALALLDVNLPGVNGYEVCQTLKTQFGRGLPVLFVSGERTATLDRVAGLMIGADDYVVKPFDPDELLARIQRLLRVADHATAGRLDSLTPREREVLQLLVDGLVQPQLAARLVISEGTVRTHVHQVLRKLGVHSRSEAIVTAVRVGMRPLPVD